MVNPPGASNALSRDRAWRHFHLFPALGLAGLLAILALQAARAWRYFPLFMGDQGWYLQVALRLSRGEVLYRDVAWAYGPLPAHALAATFRWLGPDAGWATAINAVLAALTLLLTYAALRGLLSPRPALALTAFAALAGPYVGGDLIRGHLYVYTQAAGWGMTASLAALAAALRWERSRAAGWAAAAGSAVGLAFLSKPEFGLIAAGALAAVLLAGRRGTHTRPAVAAAVMAAGATLLLGCAAQAVQSGWGPLWRGYRGYDLLAQGRFWGGGLGDKRWLASSACFWLAMASLGVGLRWRRWRWPALLTAGLALAAAAVLIAPTVLAVSPATGLAERVGLALGRFLQWLAAVPWAMLTPALLAAPFIGRSRPLPPAWWGLWAYALLANLRPLLTGYSSGLALAPGLAALWWAMNSHGDTENTESRPMPPVGFAASWRRVRSSALPPARAAPALLAVIAAVNLLAQALTPDAAFSVPRRRLDSAVGPVAVWDGPGAEAMAAVQAELERRVPAGAAIFATGWGAGWYLLADRRNPTACDVVLEGLGTGGSEAVELQRALLAAPPAAVLLPVEQWRPPPGPSRRSRDRDARAVRQGLTTWWETLAADYAEATPAGVTDWVVLVAVRE